MIRIPSAVSRTIVLSAISVAGAGGTAFASAPPIRLSETNRVPACVTPARLNAYLDTQITRRGYRVHPAHRNIAQWYRRHGESQQVRWDYAFFQMALETNFLSFRRGNGKRGDVHPRQNNFAGLGTTGGGVPGDSYPDAATGVLAQIQHLVVYSGQRLRNPTGHRTRLKQNVILQSVRKIVRRRPVTFADLAGRWAADRRYGDSIQRVANRFFATYCKGQVRAARQPLPRIVRQGPTRLIPTTTTSGRSVKGPVVRKVLQVSRKGRAHASARPVTPRPAPFRPTAAAAATNGPANSFNQFRRTAPPRIATQPTSRPLATPPGARAPACHVQTAGYGGDRAVLIRSEANGAINLTALSVYPGFEEMMAQSFIKSHAPQGRPIGAFASRRAAVAKAHAVCQQLAARASR